MESAFWQAIIDADCTVPPPHTVATLTPALLPLLSSPDPALREHLAYAIIVRWIYDGQYVPRELCSLVAQFSAHLLVDVGSSDTSSVVQRSYAALVLTDLVGYDSHAPFLESSAVQLLLEQALAHFAAEDDTRGWAPEHGFLAASVHAADLLWVLANNRYLTAADLERLLTGIARKVTAPARDVPTNDLTEHRVRAVMAALHRDLLSLPFLAAWVASLAHPARLPSWDEAYRDETDLYARHNTKIFLSSLYLQLAFPGLGNLRFIEPSPASAVLLPHVVVALNSITVWN